MIVTEINAYASFGTNSLTVGGYYVEELSRWCIEVKELVNTTEHSPGTTLDNDAIKHTGNKITLSFPTENQMIAVLAALTNQSFDVMESKWAARKVKIEEAKLMRSEWVQIDIED